MVILSTCSIHVKQPDWDVPLSDWIVYLKSHAQHSKSCQVASALKSGELASEGSNVRSALVCRGEAHVSLGVLHLGSCLAAVCSAEAQLLTCFSRGKAVPHHKFPVLPTCSSMQAQACQSRQ